MNKEFVMPHKQEFVKSFAEMAGDVIGIAGTAAVTFSWFGYVETGIGVVGGIGGLIALFFSIRLNRARYTELRLKQLARQPVDAPTTPDEELGSDPVGRYD